MFVKLPDDYTLYVNAYMVTRHYGGPEEGGWWYNMSECVETRTATPLTAEQVHREMEEKWKKEDWGDIYSVLGGVQHEVYVQREPKETEDLDRPHYE